MTITKLAAHNASYRYHLETTVPGVAGETRFNRKMSGRIGSATSRSIYVDIVPRSGVLDVDATADRFMSWMENSLCNAMLFGVLDTITPLECRQEFDGSADIHFHCIPTPVSILMDEDFNRRAVGRFILDISYFPQPLLDTVIDRMVRYRERRAAFLRRINYGYRGSDRDQSIPTS